MSNKDLIDKIVAEYPAAIEVFPRAKFNSQLKDHLRKYLK